ncbi:ABC transporter permease [Rhodoluna sp.]|jgi:simple sugar transport system permease protein|uniref:ABC transporter permease n=1 Tax=Rhodoluna sp. TaxID=1969481 RepID=UPI0025D1C1CA|nr:ABC transporter permease [Rhodoluna sp.]
MSTQVKKQSVGFGSLIRRPEFGALIGALAVYIFFAIAGGAPFMAPGGSASWLNVAAELGIIALPVALVMIAGDLDLSVGSVLAASSMTLAILSGFYGLPTWVGIIAALLVGTLIGIANGYIVTKTNLPAFVVTLATLFAVSGLTLGLTRLLVGSTAVSMTADPTTKALFGTLLDGKFSVAIFWWLGVAVLVSWILYKSIFGNWIFAIGGDVISARATGIPVAKVRIALFAASGFGAALVGVLQTCMYNGAQVANGQSFVFNSIIAVVVGGVLLTGGYGSTIGVILGTLTFAIVNQGIYYTGWNADWAALILGILLLIAVLTNNTFRRLALSGGNKKEKKN